MQLTHSVVSALMRVSLWPEFKLHIMSSIYIQNTLTAIVDSGRVALAVGHVHTFRRLRLIQRFWRAWPYQNVHFDEGIRRQNVSLFIIGSL